MTSAKRLNVATVTLTSLSVLRTYQRLYATFGPQHWWLAATAVEMVIGAILVQHSTWMSCERAIAQLKQRGALTTQGIAELPLSDLEAILRSTGYFRQKARRLQVVVAYLAKRYGDQLQGMRLEHPETLRAALLEINGIGQETADGIMLYAAQRATIVLDTYTLRIAERLGWIDVGDKLGNTRLRNRMVAALPADPVLLNEFHALLVELGKQVCKPKPRCTVCSLATYCPSARPKPMSNNPAHLN